MGEGGNTTTVLYFTDTRCLQFQPLPTALVTAKPGSRRFSTLSVTACSPWSVFDLEGGRDGARN